MPAADGTLGATRAHHAQGSARGSDVLQPIGEEWGPVEKDPTGRYLRYPHLLGRGACKHVFKAFDTHTGTEVAWNQVQLAGAELDPAALEYLFREIRLLQNLYHKNIMSFIAWWHSPQQRTINFITELFLSGTLRSYRKKVRHINDTILKRWAWQILEGLVYLHGHVPPIVHRDLKCDNIFYNANQGIVKIGDLGLATCQQGLSVVGTPEFLAPEIYEEQYDEKVDIYSFGMCLLELATQQYPYSECQRVAQIFRKVTTGIKPAALQQVTGELREMIELCIAHDPTQRPEARQLVKHPFFDSIRGLVGYERRISLPEVALSVTPPMLAPAMPQPISAPASIVVSSSAIAATTAAEAAHAVRCAAATACAEQVVTPATQEARQLSSHAIDVYDDEPLDASDSDGDGTPHGGTLVRQGSAVTSQGSMHSGFDPRQRPYHSVNEAELQLQHLRETQEHCDGVEEGQEAEGYDDSMSESSEEIVVPIDCLAHELDESDGEDEGCSKVADSLSFGMATPPPCSKARAAGLAQTLLLSKRAASRSIELTPPYGAGPVASRLARMTVACPSPADGAPCSPARPSPPAATSYVAVTPSPPSRSAVSKRFQGVLRMADLFAKVSDLGQDSARASPAPVRSELGQGALGGNANDEGQLVSDANDQSFQGPTRSMSYEPLAPGARPICGVIVRIKHVRKSRATEQIASGDNSVDRTPPAARTQSAPPSAPDFVKAMEVFRI